MVMADFKKALKSAKSGKQKKAPHFEISFDNKRDFNKFVRNLDILSMIIQLKPQSVYELAKLCEKDVSNLNKVMNFFEEIGVVKIKKSKVSGREVNTPIVNFDSIEFDLAA